MGIVLVYAIGVWERAINRQLLPPMAFIVFMFKPGCSIKCGSSISLCTVEGRCFFGRRKEALSGQVLLEFPSYVYPAFCCFHDIRAFSAVC